MAHPEAKYTSACATQSEVLLFVFILSLLLLSILCCLLFSFFLFFLFFFHWRGTWRSKWLKKNYLGKLTTCVYLQCDQANSTGLEKPRGYNQLRVLIRSQNIWLLKALVIFRAWLQHCVQMKWFLPWVAKSQSFSLALGRLKELPCCRAGESMDLSLTQFYVIWGYLYVLG